MNVKPLTIEYFDEFMWYCNKYGKQHDESYLPDSSFEIGPDNPSYLLYDDKGDLIGVASLMLESKFASNKKGRFRIIHSVQPSYDNYKALVDRILNHTDGMENIYLFIPEERSKERRILEQLGFSIQRYSWYLERDNCIVDHVSYPDGFKLKTMEFDKEEDIWCNTVNSNFKGHPGFSCMSVEEVKGLRDQKDYIDGGMLLLKQGDDIVGTVQVNMEEEDGVKTAFISWLSISKKYRGKGLGRKLLESAIRVAGENKAEKVGLVVNSLNDRAVNLYISEDFKKVQSMICYNKELF